MANQTTSHWRLPAVLDGVSRAVLAALKALERTLDRLHGRVEYPAPSLADRVACTVSTLINSTALTDITGATVTRTFEATGRIHVVMSCQFFISTFSAVGDSFAVELLVNGVAQSYGCVGGSFSAAGMREVVAQSWVVSVTAGTSYTIKLQARQVTGTSTYTVVSPRSGFTYEFVPDPYRYPSQ